MIFKRGIFGTVTSSDADDSYQEEAEDFEEEAGSAAEPDEYGEPIPQTDEEKYLAALALMEKGDCVGAFDLLIGIKGYKDVNELLKSRKDFEIIAEAEYRDEMAPWRRVNSIVSFGRYPQDGAGADDAAIEWIVLDIQENRVLLLSRYGLDAKPYNTKKESVAWENCSLRTWLNSEFLNKAFEENDQRAILTSSINNDQSECYAEWNTTGGKNTQDKVFLLSCAEAKRYLDIKEDGSMHPGARVKPTAYATRNGVLSRESLKREEAGVWWLRSPGFRQDIAADVDVDGSLSSHFVDMRSGCVRPALWVDIDEIGQRKALLLFG